MDRRAFIRIGAAASAAAAGGVAPMVGPASAAEEAPKTPQAAKDVTKSLAHYVVNARFEDLSERVRKEVARSLLNWMGVTVGGSRHQTVDIAISAVQAFAGPGQASLFGRKERLDIMNAALINGISSHVLDFDDTDLKTAVHPSAPVLPPLLAMAERKPINGHNFVTAMVMGFEAECRIARAVQPAFGDIGWHATGAAGVFGAAVATGKILGLDEERMCHAIGLAATQPVGIREMFGSMTKSFHPGRAAQNGMLAAFLAEKGYTSSLQGIEAKRGWANLVSTDHDLSIITEGLGDHFEIYRNTYKPYACGLVIHPVIDGCIQLRNEYKLTADQIEAIDVDIHPIVMELTAKKNPKTGLDNPAGNFPLIDRAISGQYAPGSTFKLITSIAGLQSGEITASKILDDRGKYAYPSDPGNIFRNDNDAVYGRIDLPRALTVSSDVYYYTIGGDLFYRQRHNIPGGDAIQVTARQYGLGKASGIGLPNEATGRVPDAAWKAKAFKDNPGAFPFPDWLPGNNVQLAVGQGDVLVTPLQLANAYASFANGGTLREPRLASEVLDASGKKVRDLAPITIGQVPVPDRDAMLAGFTGVVEDKDGTAKGIFDGFPPGSVAGKTGTAQVTGKQPTSLFVGMSPVVNPRWIVLAVVEEGGYGAQTSAPIVRRIMQGLNGIPPAPVTTLAPIAQGTN